MNRLILRAIVAMAFALFLAAGSVWAENDCPNDQDNIPMDWTGPPFTGPGLEDIDHDGDTVFDTDPNVICEQRGGADGFIQKADGTSMYTFGFSDMTGIPDEEVYNEALLTASSPAPTIVVGEGQWLYLTLFTTGMVKRPDLFDPHTIHYHGFPHASAVFDGVPDASISINPQTNFTYVFLNNDPGTYIYHCHVEATEHMEMGMIGNLWVTPLQDGTSVFYAGNGNTYSLFAYNDNSGPWVGTGLGGPGSTGHDVAYPIQVAEFDTEFHEASLFVQPLPFANLDPDTYVMNGRGYPDTTNPGVMGASPENATDVHPGGFDSQQVSSLITANPGDAVLLRLSMVGITSYSTVASLGIPMRVVGKDARLLRGPSGQDLSYMTNSVTMGGGETYDVILDIPSTAASGSTYFIYSRNLDQLNTNQMDRSGAMTEIHIN